jgi:putative spermidine/putrescine transport system substrate-binding protein
MRSGIGGVYQEGPTRSARRCGGWPAPIVDNGRAQDAHQNVEEDLTTTRSLPRLIALGAATVLIVAACAQPSGTAGPGGTAVAGQWTPPADLLNAAKGEEGSSLTTIALPHSWCNYGEVIETFKARTGLAVNELNPDAGSAEELTAIEANKDNPGPQAPDVIDVGLSFGPEAKSKGLIQEYKVSTWDTIPDSAKDADGFWYGDYYGVLAFEVNKAVIDESPADWADLKDPKYADSIALPGDPRLSSQAIQTVYASALANGGSLDDAAPGLQFWKDVVSAGNFVPTIANAGTIAQGETPITIRWTYNALANRDESAASGGPVIEVIVPESGRFAGVYVQAISAYAPHPNAAKLWMEFLYSDEGQNTWLKGYCHPIRYEDLVANDKVPADQLAKLPDVEGAVFPSLDQVTAASELITTQWDSVVGVDVAE